ncbi:HAD family hydrolase [Streptomyces sp. FxanaA7]|uniref:HAD family hydrolase n=1 Tax=Streptomyces sp. FxanaA7 TaxID=1265492 RepID=UPI0005F048DE|nr:HAD family hydrolase [Streptomyces sp. FxanaA7]
MNAPDRIRLVCTDLDGTLLNESGAVGPLTHDALTRAARGNVPVVCVTGRPLRDALSVCRDISMDGLVVCSNGAVVAEVATGKPLRCRGFSRHRARTVLARMRARLPGVVLGVDTLRGLFLERGFEELVPDCWQHVCVPDAAEVLIRGDGVVKILAVHPDRPGPSLARPLVRPGDGVLATCSTPYFLEIAPPGVDKGAALRWLADHHAIRVTAVAAVGDMPNDLPMLRAAGLAAAVANAHPSVRQCADLILPSNEEEGVADLLSMVLSAQKEEAT